MGLFDSDEQDPIAMQRNMEIDTQFKQNQAELKQKKDALYAQRLDIIKSGGNQNWTSSKPTPASTAPGMLGNAKRRDNVGRDTL